MNLLQQLQEDANVPFNQETTHMATYDDMMKDPEYFRNEKGRQFRILHMSPDEYIDRAAEGFSLHHGFSRKEALRGREGSSLVDQYAEKMQHGEKFPMVVLDHSSRRTFSGEREKSFSQEGLHRALAAKKIGVDKIPVMVVDDA